MSNHPNARLPTPPHRQTPPTISNREKVQHNQSLLVLMLEIVVGVASVLATMDRARREIDRRKHLR